VTSRGEIVKEAATSGDVAYRKKRFPEAAYSLRGDHVPLVNRAEIESGRFWKVGDVFRLLTEHPECSAPSFVRVFREFQQRNLLP
jgi:hypothetical protein